jgi:hypothetical protein
MVLELAVVHKLSAPLMNLVQSKRQADPHPGNSTDLAAVLWLPPFFGFNGLLDHIAYYIFNCVLNRTLYGGIHFIRIQ